MVNMGQGSLYVDPGFRIMAVTEQMDSDYNPPDFVLNAAKEALDHVDCNQYPPTKVKPPFGNAAFIPYLNCLSRADYVSEKPWPILTHQCWEES